MKRVMDIGELEDLLGVSDKTIRYYEEQGLVTPPCAEDGYRDYGDEEVRLFQKIIVLRKLGVSVPEIKELIDGKADLRDVLENNLERLRARQDENASAIEMCGDLVSEAADFAGIDSPKYLRNIYEAEQNGTHFAETGEISSRQLHLAVTLLGAMAGIAIPQNVIHSEHGNEPVPADIRGNKKEGDEYDTIGDVLRKGGIRKAVLIIVAAIFAAFLLINGIFIWGGFGASGKFAHDFSKAGIEAVILSDDEIADLAKIDPEVNDANDYFRLFRFHTQGGLQLSVKRSESGSWTEVFTDKTNAKEGYLFVTGGPSSVMEFHIIADGKSQKFGTEIGDSTFDSEEEESTVMIDQEALNEQWTILLYCRDYDTWKEVEKITTGFFYTDVMNESLPDSCYAVVVQAADQNQKR